MENDSPVNNFSTVGSSFRLGTSYGFFYPIDQEILSVSTGSFKSHLHVFSFEKQRLFFLDSRHHNNLGLVFFLFANGKDSGLIVVFTTFVSLFNTFHDLVTFLIFLFLLFLQSKLSQKFTSHIGLLLFGQNLLFSPGFCPLQLLRKNLCSFKVRLIDMTFLFKDLALLSSLELLK